MEFKLDADELPQGEADGTGIGIKGSKKRGKELKVFVQYKRGGNSGSRALISGITTVLGTGCSAAAWKCSKASAVGFS
jgi:hypothetical protein